MAKTRYYIINENGEEQIVRTSNREYNYYCLGSCSKTWEGAEKTRKEKLGFAMHELEYEKKLQAQPFEKRVAKVSPSMRYLYTDEHIAKDIEGWEKEIEYLRKAPVFDLYAK